MSNRWILLIAVAFLPVTAYGAAILLVDKTSINLNDGLGTAAPRPNNPPSGTFRVLNSGDASGSFSVQVTNARYCNFAENCTSNSWLGVSPTAGSVSPGGSSIITVSANSGLIANGTYTATVNVRNAANQIVGSVAISYFVNGNAIVVTPNVMSFTIPAGTKQQQQFTVLYSVGGGPISFSTSGSAGGGWLKVNASGEVNAGPYMVLIDSAGLQPGTYNGAVTVICFSAGPCLGQAVAVTLNVTAPVQARLNLDASPIAFTFQPASPFACGSIFRSITSTVPSTPLSFSATSNITTPPQGSWLKVSALGTTTPGSVSITCDPTGLGPGTFDAKVSIFGSDKETPFDVIAVSLVVTAAPALTAAPTSVSFQATTGSPLPAPQTVRISTANESVVTISASAASPGNWLRVVADKNTTPATLTMTVISLPPQSSTGTVTVTPAAGAQPLSIPVTLTVGAPLPTIGRSGVTKAGAYGTSTTVGPGTYIEIFGSNLARTSREWAGADFIGSEAPTSLDGVSIRINGRSAYIRFVSEQQVNALVPDGVGTGPMQMTLTNANGTSVPYTIEVETLKPGLLAPASFTAAGRQYIAAFISSNTSALPRNAVPGVNSRPAAPGEVLTIYGIGFGPVTPDVPAGRIAPSQLTALRTPVQILFGQTPASILYQGLAAGFVGLYQFNVTVPAVPDNDAVPLTVNQGGRALDQSLFIAVRR